MKLYRIWAIILRYTLAWCRNINNFLDDALWPVLDIVLWGMTSLWIQENQNTLPTTILTLLTCVVLWYVVQRSNDAVSMNALEELWERNLINLFSTPLTIVEWIVAIIALSFMRILYTLIVCSITVWILYSLNIFQVGWMILPFFFSLLLSGLFIGFFTTAFVMRWGRKAVFFAWTVSWIFSPFSGVYYPVDMLPKWAQCIGYTLPMTYAFQGIRILVTQKTLAWHDLSMSLGLNVIYLGLSILFFIFMFERSRVKGLTSF